MKIEWKALPNSLLYNDIAGDWIKLDTISANDLSKVGIKYIFRIDGIEYAENNTELQKIVSWMVLQK